MKKMLFFQKIQNTTYYSSLKSFFLDKIIRNLAYVILESAMGPKNSFFPFLGPLFDLRFCWDRCLDFDLDLGLIILRI